MPSLAEPYRIPDVRVTLHREGLDPVDLSRLYEGLRFSTNAVGGFGSCSMQLPGFQRKLLTPLSLLRVTYGPIVLFEGRIEDPSTSLEGQLGSGVEAFGNARLFDDVSVRRIWSLRAFEPEDIEFDFTYDGGSIFTHHPELYSLTANGAGIGHYDPTDLTKFGVKIIGVAGTSEQGYGHVVEIALPTGLTAVRFLADVYNEGFSPTYGADAVLFDSADRSTWQKLVSVVPPNTTGTLVDVATTASARYFRLGIRNHVTAEATTSGTYVEFRNIRVLGTTVDEDVQALGSGGIYGGSVLRDLIALVPGLTIGAIDTGSDFALETIERAVRSSARSVLEEVTSFYSKEWGVWEDGRFDWRQTSEGPGWIVRLEDVSSLRLSGTIDELVRTVYVLYSDAASGLEAEASASSTDQRNPYVKQGKTKDATVSPGFPMTPNTATQLATRLAADRGSYVPVRGSLSLPLEQLVLHADGDPRPAFSIRGGDNVQIVGLPASDPFAKGRDGETFFHVASVEVNADRKTVSLTLESQARVTDVILARLAAVTRNLTS